MAQPPSTPPPVLFPVTPPLLPYVPPRREPVWPKVVGIISLCLGGLHLLCGLVGMLVSTALQSMMGAFPRMRFPRPLPTTGPATRPHPEAFPFEDFNPFEMFQIPDWIHYGQIAFQVLGLLVAGLLLYAGISLLQKRRRGRSLHLVYVVLQTLTVAGTVVITVALMNSIFPSAPRFFRKMIEAQSVLGAVMQALIGLAYPVFLLVWFCRRKIRAQVAEWNGRPPAAQAS